MCGIAGFIGKGDEGILRKMITAIQYRGPDFQGVHVAENVGLAQARLSIIDLSEAAHQPFFSADKNLAIVFNGEIYNFLSLKNELLKTGKYSFRTNSDTEVLIYLYQEYKAHMLDKLQGMFAFALYDFSEKKLFVARDRMGKKPLYYSIVGNTLLFASELKAILQHPLATKEINLDAVNAYLTFEYVPTPMSILNGIKKLEAATYFIWQNDKIVEQKKYWHHQFQTQNISFDDAKNQLDDLLNDATECRMMADVPLGVFLSGGLDSSTIAYYAQKNSTQKIKTFSIGFDDKSYDESDYANQVAKHLGTEHYQKILTPKHALDLIPTIYGKCDEPFADASLIPTYLLSQFTREKVTVALGGDGSDELMAGYPTFISHQLIHLMQFMPGKNLLRSLANHLPPSDKNISLDFKIKQFLKGFEINKNFTHTLWLGSFSPKEKNKLWSGDSLRKLSGSNGLELISQHLQNVKTVDFLSQVNYIYYQTYLLDDILVKVDRASMYNSLECRSPFLDKRVVEFLNTLPANFKFKNNTGKYILKEVMRNKLPNNIIFRPKKGFGIPLSHWLRNDLKQMSDELLCESALNKHGLFNPKFVQQLKTEHEQKKNNHRKLLWTLICFQLFYQQLTSAN